MYALSGGKTLYIQPWPGGEGKLLYSGEDGELRVLSGVALNVYTGGPGLLVATPVELKISFAEDGRGGIQRLLRRRNGGAQEPARRLTAYRSEVVRFANGGVSLAGSLWTPAGKGPHAALVLLHGTGRTDRNNVLPLTHFLVTHGVALLGFDKRGVSESSGDWRTASLQDLAGDVLAAVRFLAGRKEIDPKRIGVFGASQGGWLAPLVASQSQEVALSVTVSGPGMSPAELEITRLKHSLRSKGFADGAVDEALGLLQLANEVARGTQHWERYQAKLASARDAKWFRFLSVPLEADSWLFDHWRSLPLDFDPAPAIAGMRVPALAIFGALDQTVLASDNAGKWRAGFEQGGNKDYTIKILSGANHMLLEAQTGEEEEFPMLRRLVPQYAPTLLEWLKRRGFAK